MLCGDDGRLVLGSVNGGDSGRVMIFSISHSSSSLILDKLSFFMIHVYIFLLMFAYEVWDNLCMY